MFRTALVAFAYVQASQDALLLSIHMRDSVTIALLQLKEACGLPNIANIKQCIRSIANRIQATSSKTDVTFTVQNEVRSTGATLENANLQLASEFEVGTLAKAVNEPHVGECCIPFIGVLIIGQ